VPEYPLLPPPCLFMLYPVLEDGEDARRDVPSTAVPRSRHTYVDRAPTSGLIVGRFAEPASYTVNRGAGAQSWLLILTEAGAGWVRIAGSTVELPRGSAVLLPPNVAHGYGTAAAQATWRFWWAHFQMRRSWLERFDGDVITDGFGVAQLAEPMVADLVSGFGRLHAAARWPGYGPLPAEVGDDQVALAASDLGWAIAAPQVEILLVQLSSTRVSPAVRPSDDRVSQVLALVAADPAAPHSVARLARRVSLSPSRLAHVCTAELGRPLMHEVRRIRLEHAARLLVGTELSVAQVARASGFASPFHFSRSFSVQFSLAPTAFRAAQKRG